MSDMESEKIFVVVPVYKVEAYLERCIAIIHQHQLGVGAGG